MSTCGICLKDFNPDTQPYQYQTRGHNACVDAETAEGLEALEEKNRGLLEELENEQAEAADLDQELTKLNSRLANIQSVLDETL
jgi:chromosome segregation ATPase